MRRSLPVLDSRPDALDLAEIPIPCEVPWDAMPGDEQVRHCGQCKQNVYNVEAFTRAEALRLLGARVCLRIYRRPDNTVITSDCRERLRAARKRGLLVFAGVALVVLWAQICAQFVGIMGLRRLVGGDRTMGEPVAIPLPGQIAVPSVPPLRTAGVPRLPEAEAGTPRPPKKIIKHYLGGKPAPRHEKMGKMALPPIDD